MSDQCRHCTAHGDIEACLELPPCSIRESWAYCQLERELREAKERIKQLEGEFAGELLARIKGEGERHENMPKP